MTKSGINLVSTQISNTREAKRLLILKWISLIFLGSIAVFSALLFILSSRISIESIKRNEDSTLSKISLMSERNAKYNLLTDRLKFIKIIINSRKNYISTLKAIVEQLPSDANVRSLTLDKDGILISVSSTSLLPINQFLSNITENPGKKIIKDITIEGLTVDKQTGIYSISIRAKQV